MRLTSWFQLYEHASLDLSFNARSECRPRSGDPLDAGSSPCPFRAIRGGPTCSRGLSWRGTVLMSNVRNLLSASLHRFRDTFVGVARRARAASEPDVVPHSSTKYALFASVPDEGCPRSFGLRSPGGRLIDLAASAQNHRLPIPNQRSRADQTGGRLGGLVGSGKPLGLW